MSEYKQEIFFKSSQNMHMQVIFNLIYLEMKEIFKYIRHFTPEILTLELTRVGEILITRKHRLTVRALVLI